MSQLQKHSRRAALGAFGTSAVSTLGGNQDVADTVKGGRRTVEHFATTARGELIDRITLTGGRPYRYSSLYTLKIPSLAQGEIIQAHCQFQIANNVFRSTGQKLDVQQGYGGLSALVFRKLA